MSHAIATAATAHPTPATTAEGVGIIALFLIVAAPWLARRWREARRENARMEARRVAALAQAKDQLAAALAAQRAFKARIRGTRPDPYGDRYLLDQHRQDVAVARANVRDLETW